jgi:hypothetical protein
MAGESTYSKRHAYYTDTSDEKFGLLTVSTHVNVNVSLFSGRV